jgi:hypothetical protein
MLLPLWTPLNPRLWRSVLRRAALRRALRAGHAGPNARRRSAAKGIWRTAAKSIWRTAAKSAGRQTAAAGMLVLQPLAHIGWRAVPVMFAVVESPTAEFGQEDEGRWHTLILRHRIAIDIRHTIRADISLAGRGISWRGIARRISRWGPGRWRRLIRRWRRISRLGIAIIISTRRDAAGRQKRRGQQGGGGSTHAAGLFLRLWAPSGTRTASLASCRKNYVAAMPRRPEAWR